MFYDKLFAFTIPPSRLREPPPFTQGRLITARQYTKSITRYTLQARRVKRSTNKLLVLLMIFRQANLLYGRHPLMLFFRYGVNNGARPYAPHTACSGLSPHTIRLKTVHRTVFFTAAALLGFEPLLLSYTITKKQHPLVLFFVMG